MEELDKFKNIKDKVSFDPVHSTREKDLWEALEQRIHTYESAQKKKTKVKHLLYYATAACVLLGLSLGYYLITPTNNPQVALESSKPSVISSPIEAKTSSPSKDQGNEPSKIVSKDSPQDNKALAFITNPATHTVEASATKYLTLADGSTLALDAHSHLQQQPDFNLKRDVLLEGQAYFEVAHDKAHPFTVYFGNTHLVVLGTKFYVRNLQPDSYTVAVVEGSVKVYNPTTKKYTVLAKDQQLIMAAGQLLPVQTLDPQIGTWRKNALKFDDTPLSEVFYTLSKAHEKEISYAPGLAGCRFSGNLSQLNLVEALNFIKLTAQIEIEDKNDHVYIAGKACH